ncbi:MAG TPA: YfjP family GTPase, partial [Actinomycetota bacterium]|nr:YfjP family GTPase [Actinomycetota bacterium]
QAPDLDDRLQALRRVVDIGRDRFEPSLVDDARGVLDRGTERMGFGKNVTVVALTGATGTGKSSLFNRLSGSDLSPVGVRRPTTSKAQAAVWGEASDVLDWLGVARRHGLSDPELDGLVLLDLPDHDSTQTEHRIEADRLVQLVDVFVWVVDPQKYADAVLHDDYLRPLAGPAAVTLVVLNQVDRLTETERRQCLADLSRLLKQDGLTGVKVLSTSTVTGEGLDALQETIAARVHEERAAAERLSADLDGLAARLAPLCGSASSPGLGGAEQESLVDALAEAARVEVVATAVARAHRRQAALAMGWPFTRWLRRFRPDPLNRLHLGRGGEGGRTSLPEATPVQRAQVDTAVRRAANAAASGLPDPWPDSIKRRVADSSETLLPDLDASVSSTDLEQSSRPGWWSIANGVQTLLATVAILGFAWLAVLFALEWFQIPRPPTPEVENVPWPTLALLGGLLVGFLLSLLFQQLARLGARRRASRVRKALREGVARIADRDVIEPIRKELGHLESFCAALATLRRAGK